MMKKLVLMLMLVLGMASMAWAAPYFQVAADDAAVYGGHYAPSQWITIEMRDNRQDSNVAGFMVDWITDNTGGPVIGTADEPQLFHPSFAFTYPGNLNTGNKLVEYVSAAAGDAAPDELLYSFEYHVPDLPMSTIIEIQTDWDNVDWWAPWIDYRDASNYEGAVAPVLLHVIPEPTTMALLGLGGLFLSRRSKKRQKA